MKTKQPQTATGFLAAMLIGFIVGGILYYAITAPIDARVEREREYFKQAHELHRDAERWMSMARNAR